MTGALILAFDVAALSLNGIAVIRAIRGEVPWLMLASGNILALITTAALRLWPLAAVDAACALFALWRRRKNKRRLRALLSGKYRHVRDATVRTLRDRRVARPVLAPGRA